MRQEKFMRSQWDYGYRLERVTDDELVFWLYDDDGDHWMRAAIDADGRVVDIHGFNWHSFEAERTYGFEDAPAEVTRYLCEVAGDMLGSPVVVADTPNVGAIDRVRWDVAKADAWRSTDEVTGWWFTPASE